MAQRPQTLSLSDTAHVAGRVAMALCIGWGYLALVIALDVGGWGTWLRQSPFGPMARAQLVSIMGVAFGAVGGHVGLSNVRGPALAAHRARLAERRAAMRRWQRD